MVESGVPTICSRLRSFCTRSRPLKPVTTEPTPKAISTTLARIPPYWKTLLILPFLSCATAVDESGGEDRARGQPRHQQVPRDRAAGPNGRRSVATTEGGASDATHPCKPATRLCSRTDGAAYAPAYGPGHGRPHGFR